MHLFLTVFGLAFLVVVLVLYVYMSLSAKRDNEDMELVKKAEESFKIGEKAFNTEPYKDLTHFNDSSQYITGVPYFTEKNTFFFDEPDCGCNEGPHPYEKSEKPKSKKSATKKTKKSKSKKKTTKKSKT